MPIVTPVQKMKSLSHITPVVRAVDAVRAGIPRTSLVRMVESGVVERVGRGLYRLAESEGYDHPDLLEAALRVPKGVVVLLSALNFHGIGTQVARQVWMQLPANYPTPRIGHPPLRIVRSRKPEAFTLGVETHRIAGNTVKITDPDRTIVDCFRHRGTVTLEVCLEALRERLRNRRQCLPALEDYARKLGAWR
ncbi:MAG: type IV toxin-antitoxin system AbiEi family antitoxin domain-containing protein, partial [Verrucomicrobia bacterium]|nr:type IV toxin-antitoxin system AbiEi family antitoxin domain-containing protein [Verrucomicrobiota bacterium]